MRDAEKSKCSTFRMREERAESERELGCVALVDIFVGSNALDGRKDDDENEEEDDEEDEGFDESDEREGEGEDKALKLSSKLPSQGGVTEDDADDDSMREETSGSPIE